MRKLKNEIQHRWAAFLIAVVLSMAMTPTAFADTGDTTPKITQQPDQLVLQLGTRWAGVEFELRTDAGIFPVPVVVDETGVLRMDLGGSTTYTLSCIDSSVPIPSPLPDPEPEDTTSQPLPEPPVQVPQQTEPEPSPTSAPAQQSQPIWPLMILLMALAAAGGGFAVMQITKRRQQAAYDEWADDDEEEE